MSCTSQQRQDWFILKSEKIHSNKYDYSKVRYKNARSNVTIVCEHHGDFNQLPTHHLKGCGCPKCANNTTLGTTEFINRSNKVHQNFYTYSKVKYVNSRTKVTITCPVHGDFNQLPCHHIRGSKCPACAGRDHDVIYLWRLGNTSLFKLGISCQTNVKSRINKVAAAHSVEPTKVSIFTVSNSRDLESKLLHYFKDYKQKNQVSGEGHTEILDLTEENYLKVISYIKKYGVELQNITDKIEG